MVQKVDKMQKGLKGLDNPSPRSQAINGANSMILLKNCKVIGGYTRTTVILNFLRFCIQIF